MNLDTLIKKTFRRLFTLNILNNVQIDKTSKIYRRCIFNNVKVSKYTYFGEGCRVDNAIIGAFCSIANNVIIGPSEHTTNYLSTSPVFFKGKNILNENFLRTEEKSPNITTIMNDVWVGNNVLIKQGVKIGNGAIVAMGSVVTKDVEPYSIVGGAPAKLIRYRFDQKTIDLLEEVKWFEFDKKKLNHYLPLFTNPYALALKIYNDKNSK